MKRRLKEMEEEADTLHQLLSRSGNFEEVTNFYSTCQRELDYRSIFVMNVNFVCTPEEIQWFFASCGVVNKVTIQVNKFGHSKGYTFVEFEDKETVPKALALSRSILRGRSLRILPKRTNIFGFKRWKNVWKREPKITNDVRRNSCRVSEVDDQSELKENMISSELEASLYSALVVSAVRESIPDSFLFPELATLEQKTHVYEMDPIVSIADVVPSCEPCSKKILKLDGCVGDQNICSPRKKECEEEGFTKASCELRKSLQDGSGVEVSVLSWAETGEVGVDANSTENGENNLESLVLRSFLDYADSLSRRSQRRLLKSLVYKRKVGYAT